MVLANLTEQELEMIYMLRAVRVQPDEVLEGIRDYISKFDEGEKYSSEMERLHNAIILIRNM